MAVGPATGTPISGQSRMTAVAKSPLTDAIGDSQCGGFLPAEIKFAGFDAIVVRGRAEEPVYLWLHDGEAELRPARHLWGKTTGEAQAILRQELGDEKVEVAQCGIGGENGVRFASIINMANRANGRTGMGAVMGSKNLKAIAVRGTTRPQVADRKALQALAKWGADHFEESGIYTLGVYGTAQNVGSLHHAGMLPTGNWCSGVFDGGWQSLDGATLKDTLLKERDTCYACIVRCKRVVEAENGYKLDPLYGGPEYETIAAFGSYARNSDLRAVAYANQLCNMYGIDTISCGATIAWAIDCFENGILTRADTGGLELRWGDGDMIVRLTEMIARREGFGAVLAEGSARAAARFGKEAEELLSVVKKQELPAHEPRVKRSLSLIYAVNPFGADHQSSEHDGSYAAFPERMAQIGLTDPQPAEVMNEEKVRYALTTQYAYSCLDSVSVCQFVFGPAWHLYSMEQLAELMQAVTGWDVTVPELLRVGERRLNLLRAFNAREGIGREQDVLPAKAKNPLAGGPTEGIQVTDEELEWAKDRYYALAGWDVSTGMPTRQKLVGLDLEWVADKLGQ
jgi:aldehyde:ferredoxin oxidoreductase